MKNQTGNRRNSAVSVLLFCLSLVFFSCESVQEHYEKQAKKCIESKWEIVENMRGENYPKSVEAAIAKYDYEVAHLYADCYPTDEDAVNSQAKIIEKITRSEISYYIMQLDPPEINRARAVAAENNLQEVFDDVYSQYINILVENKEYEKAIDALGAFKLPVLVTDNYKTAELSEYEMKHIINDSWSDKKDVYFRTEIHDFYMYDNAASKVNSVLDVILNEAIRNNNRKLADECLRNYKKRVKMDQKGKGDRMILTFSLIDSDKNAAKQKLKEAGM